MAPGPDTNRKDAAINAMMSHRTNILLFQNRAGVSRETVVDIFLQFQDYVNAKYQTSGEREIDFSTHEEDCRRALDVLLYGVVERAAERKDVGI